MTYQYPLSPGQVGVCFGETGLLHGALRNASIIASCGCQLGAISKPPGGKGIHSDYST